MDSMDVGDEASSANRAERGVSTTIGFILVFSFLVISFTIYQGIVIPEQNRKIEFDHNDEVQTQIQELRTAVRDAAADSESSISVRLGADYPDRTLAQNLGASTGQLRTVNASGGIRIENVTATNAETADYVGESSTTLGTFRTKSVRYAPNYMMYQNAPETVYENTVAYNQFEGGQNITLTEQAIVDGRRITLVAVNGSLSKAQAGTVTVDIDSLSPSTSAIAVTNTSGGKLNVTIPTDLSAANWSDLLSEEIDEPGNDDRYVVDVRDTGPNQVSILFEQDVTYDLRLAKVGIGTGTTEEDAHYVTDVKGMNASISEGGSQKLVVEVRDRFNNPVSNVTIESEITDTAGSGDLVSPDMETSDTDGRASFVYEAPGDVDDTQEAEITVFFDGKQPGRQNVTFTVDVLDADGSGGATCGDDPGTGKKEPWCASDPGVSVSQPGGVITGVGSASHINLSNPHFASIRPTDGTSLPNEERFRIAFVLEKDQDDLTGTTRYMFVVPDTRQGFMQNLDANGVGVSNKGVVVYKDASVNDDGAGYDSSFINTNLKGNDLESWYNGTLELDLLDNEYYSANVGSELTEIQNFVDSNDVRIYIVDMDGRTRLIIE